MLFTPLFYYFFIDDACIPKFIYFPLQTPVEKLNKNFFQFYNILLLVNTREQVYKFILGRIKS